MADADGAPPRRVAWVTGGSRGVGRGVAVALGQAGWVVYVTARSSADGRTGHLPGTVEQTADAVTAAGGSGVAVPCDHRDDDGGPGGRGPDHRGSRPAGPARQQRVGRLRAAERRRLGGMERAVLGAAARAVRRDVRRRGAGALRRGGGVRSAAHRDPAQPGGDGLGGGARDRAARVRRRLRDGQDRGRPPRAGRRDPAGRARRGLARGAPGLGADRGRAAVRGPGGPVSRRNRRKGSGGPSSRWPATRR